MPIGSKIKSLRIERGLTQKQLGDLCGMADSAIRRYESDRGNPTEKTIRRIAAALGVSVAYLQSWDEAVADLEAAGMSINDVAEEMNIPVERIMEIMSNQGVNSSEAAEKIILVASLLADEANKATACNEIRGSMALEQKLAHIGYSIGCYEEDAVLWINYPDGTLEVTEADLKALNESADSYLRFKLEELKEAHKDKFRPKK